MKKIMLYIMPLFILALLPFNASARMVKEQPVGEIPFAIAGDSRIYVTAFVNGSVKSLPELEGERLPYGNSNSGEVIFMNKWISTISAGKYQG